MLRRNNSRQVRDEQYSQVEFQYSFESYFKHVFKEAMNPLHCIFLTVNFCIGKEVLEIIVWVVFSKPFCKLQLSFHVECIYCTQW